jgi:hypothetical protein
MKSDPRFWEVFYRFGPCDGGCLIFAKALLLAFGPGKLVRITRTLSSGIESYNQTEHYGVVIGDCIYDGEGAYSSPKDWLERFAERENLILKTLSIGEGFDEESEIPDDAAASKLLARIASESLHFAA